MKEEQDDVTRPASQPLPGFNGGSRRVEEEQSPLFTPPDEPDDLWVESDRDRDFSPGYRPESIEDDDFDGLLPEELEAPDDDTLFEEQSAFLRSAATEGNTGSYFRAEEAAPESTRTAEPREPADGNDWDEPEEPWDDSDDEWLDRDEEPQMTAGSRVDDNDEWGHDDDYAGDDNKAGWPIGLIAVAVLALVLLGAGGYGVMEQRAETRQEIHELRAELATAASPQEVDSSRAALQQAREENARLSGRADRLAADNQRLVDTVAGLEAQLVALEAETARKLAEVARPAATTKPKAPAEQPTAPAPAQPQPTAGAWFVNFGSYGDRNLALDWAGKLKPSSGQVIVAEGVREGRTFYRVRVVGLGDKPAAENVARQLERSWNLSKLWVGKQ